MQRRSVSTKINSVIGLAIGAGLILTTVALYLQTRTANRYQTLIAGTVASRRQAIEAQFHLKGQVQEWKNVLIRGADASARDKHFKAFAAEEQTVQAIADSLTKQLTDSSERALATGFRTAHQTLGQEYRTAFTAFEASAGAGMAQADAALKGKDRAPVALLDSLADALSKNAEASIAAERASSNTTRLVVAGLALLIFAFTTIVAVRIGRSLSSRLAKVVQRVQDVAANDLDRLARAATGLSKGELAVDRAKATAHVEATDNDEVTDLTHALNRTIDASTSSSAALTQAISVLQGLLSETSALAEAAREGNLARRGDAAQFEGAYRTLVGGINPCSTKRWPPFRKRRGCWPRSPSAI